MAYKKVRLLCRCMIMDDNGNVNLHTDFIEKPGDIEGQHIVKKVLQFERVQTGYIHWFDLQKTKEISF